jgi:hypothetical protein
MHSYINPTSWQHKIVAHNLDISYFGHVACPDTASVAPNASPPTNVLETLGSSSDTSFLPNLAIAKRCPALRVDANSKNL